MTKTFLLDGKQEMQKIPEIQILQARINELEKKYPSQLMGFIIDLVNLRACITVNEGNIRLPASSFITGKA